MLKSNQYRVIGGMKYMLTHQVAFSTGICPPKAHQGQFVSLRADGVLLLEVGYAWDGPSGPTVDTADFMAGALAHDGLYQLLRQGVLPASYRVLADQYLRKLCRKDGMPWWRAGYVYLGVRLFGASSARRAD